MERIVLIAVETTSEEQEILELLRRAPVAPRQAAHLLALTLPRPLSKSHFDEKGYHFQPSKLRLLRIAWNHSNEETVTEAGLQLAEQLSHLQHNGEEEALQILARIIEQGDTRGYGVKAQVYMMAWSRCQDASAKKKLASQAEQAFLDGMKHRDARCALRLAHALWPGRMLRRSLERAKACWLLAAEWGERLRTLARFGYAVKPRPPSAPWKNNPDADASVCLEYVLETAEASTTSQCIPGLFYYLRPGVSREEHLRMWTVEPNDSKTVEQFLRAMTHRNSFARVF